MSESIKIGIFVSIGLLLAIIATWDLLFGARRISNELIISSASRETAELSVPGPITGMAEIGELAEAASIQATTKEPNAIEELQPTIAHSNAAPVDINEYLTSVEPVAQDSQQSAPSQVVQTSQTSDNSESLTSSQTSILSRQTITSASVPGSATGSNASDNLISNESGDSRQIDPAIAIARNATERLERSLKRQQRTSEQQLQSVTARTVNQPTTQTSQSRISKASETAAALLDPNTHKALSITYRPDTQITCALPSDRAPNIDVQYRRNSYSIKGISLLEIDRLVQAYRKCGGKLSITKNELSDSESDAELYTRRKNEVKYLLTQLRVKKGDMVFSDSETTDITSK